MAVPFKFELGHTVILKDRHGRESRYHVRAVKADGWMFEPYDCAGERRFFSGEEIRRIYMAGLFRYQPYDDDVIPAARLRRLRKEFLAQPKAAKEAALRKLAFVRACEKAMAAGATKGDALTDVPLKVVAEKGDAWRAKDLRAAEERFEEREARGLLKPGEVAEVPAVLKEPCARTVWGWIKRYVESGRSISSLLDAHEDKGRRGSQLDPAQDAALAEFFKEHLRNGGFVLAAAYVQLCEDLESKGVAKIGRRTFKRRLLRERDRRGMVALEQGSRTARRTGRISERPPMPLFPLHQAESDHTLLNVKVIDDETGIDLGRPWTSAFRDRLTQLPLGLHMSFLPPSWATQSRALAHSMWPKDLSEHPQIRNAWVAEGVMDEIYTDRGMDYISDASRYAAAKMAFEFLNLPGFSPWLKGGMERWNRDLKAEILTFRDGMASFKDPEFKGRNFPKIKLSELKEHILSWVVDDYANDEHTVFDGVSRNEVWRMELDRHGPPRPVRDFEMLRRMTMIPKRRTIQNRGVEFGGFFYRDMEGRLADLLKRHDAPTDYLILVDPFDSGYIELEAFGEFIVCLNEFAGMDGVSRHRAEAYWKHAGVGRPEEKLSLDDFQRAREAVDADAERVIAIGPKINNRGSQNLLGMFRDIGEFITPVPLRPVRFDPPPIVLPGLVEHGGVIRLATRPEPTLRSTTPIIATPARDPMPLRPQRPEVDHVNAPAAPPPSSTATKQDPTADAENVFAQLAARAKERSMRFNA